MRKNYGKKLYLCSIASFGMTKNHITMEEQFLSMINGGSAGDSIIKIIGVGGGGGNAVNYMYKQGIHGVDFVVCNTDEQDLQGSPIAHKIQLGKKLTEGLGAGSIPEVGSRAAEESAEEIQAMLQTQNTKMVFIIAGMGGGTGTGATPLIAKIAKSMNILTIAVVTTPYKDEGDRYEIAMAGIDTLKPNTDAMLVIANEKIYEEYSELEMEEAEDKANELLCVAVRGIAEIITIKGARNTDFADLRKVMENSGRAIMGTGRASGANRATEATMQAINSKLLDCDIKGAKGLLINIVQGEKKVLLSERRAITDYVISQTGPQVSRKIGLTTNLNYGEDLGVTIIVTGFDNNITQSTPKTDHTTIEIPQPTNGNTDPLGEWDEPTDEDSGSMFPNYIEPQKPRKPRLLDPNVPESEKVRPTVDTKRRPAHKNPTANNGSGYMINSSNELVDALPAYLKRNLD
jgi:cell division protein FtsZ